GRRPRRRIDGHLVETLSAPQSVPMSAEDGTPSLEYPGSVPGSRSMGENTQVDVKKLSFERAIEELESIVRRLEEGKVPLEESVAIYERGEALKRRCEELLRQAEARVEKITTSASGEATGVEPLDVRGAFARADGSLLAG